MLCIVRCFFVAVFQDISFCTFYKYLAKVYLQIKYFVKNLFFLQLIFISILFYSEVKTEKVRY